MNIFSLIFLYKNEFIIHVTGGALYTGKQNIFFER